MGRRSWRRRGVMLVCAGAVAAAALLVPLENRIIDDIPAFTGFDPGATLTPARLRGVGVRTHAGNDVELLVDGSPAKTYRAGDRILLAGAHLRDGSHTLAARVRHHLLPDLELSSRFTLDGTPPRLSVTMDPVGNLREHMTLRGQASGASAVTVDGRTARVGDDGRFAMTLPVVPAVVRVTARDAAGNATTRDEPVHTRHPGMRAVHMSGMAWGSATLREPVLQMARQGLIDTVELDIKDESGEVGYSSRVPLAQQIGATRGYYDAAAVVSQLHAMGVRVVGRLVAFHDPILAKASWESGHPNRVLQRTDGTPWSGSYGQYAFTNFADPEVVGYNVDLATEAAKLGFDDILYDYVRRPEGDLSAMRITGLRGTPEQAIADFLAKSLTAVHEHGAFLGASVFGIAAQRPTAIAQDIPAMAAHLDYVAPMVYPSHWGPGEYGVAQPDSQPYDIVARSLAAFVGKVKGTDAAVIPWLQAFSLGKTYGPAEVRAQIKATADTGISSFLLWDAACRYDSAGLTG
ncbi:putative glycoside hydrolase [Actinophytocola sp.]|uniref:putative glycoside hydrolase n=1 Tax=Actinophytocola sp. TaxID=1872138 RepID=UPI00389A09EE